MIGSESVRDLPKSIEAEASVLGAVMLDANILPQLRQRVLDDAVFWEPLHRAVWSTMCELDDDGKPVEVLSVLDAMLQAGRLSDRANDVANLSSQCVSVHNVDAHLTIIIDHYKRRRIHSMMANASEHALKARPEDALNWMQDQIDTLRTGTVDDVEQMATATEVLKACFEMWEKQQAGERTNLITGLEPFDKLTGGLVPGFNYVLGALSGQGKTTFASAIAMRFLQSHPDAIVHWYSSEVPEHYQMIRLMAQAVVTSGASRVVIPERDLLDPSTSRKNPEQLFSLITKVAAEVRGYNLKIFRQGTIDVRTLRNRVRATRINFPDKPMLVVVDYIQNATAGRTESRGVDIGVASNVIREVAVDQNVMCLTLTQFTESASNTPIPMPNIRNSRWAKDIENDATEYLVYHRPWLDNRVILQQAKSRYGELGHVKILTGMEGFEVSDFNTDGVNLHTMEKN